MTNAPTGGLALPSAAALRSAAERRGSNLGNYDLLHAQTPSQTLGPFFAQGLVRTRAAFQLPHLCSDEHDVIGNELVTDATPGERLRLEGVVYDGLGAPIGDALVEIWQADADGRYAHALDPRARTAAFQGFGRAPTDSAGRFSFETIKPGKVPAFGGGVQAPHINVLLGARGMTQIAFTRVYFPEDAELATDSVLARVPAARRSTLIARRADAAGGPLISSIFGFRAIARRYSSNSDRTSGETPKAVRMTLVLSSAIFAPAFVDAEVARRLDDAAYYRALLEVEAALARTQGRLGVIPGGAARTISDAALALPFDAAALAAGVLRDGIPITALVAQLRAAVAVEARPYVHWGVTSQDIMDTATVLCLTRALALLEQGLGRLLRRLAEIAREHRASVMVARTHGQQALPTTFGLAVVLWAAPLLRHGERLRELRPRLAVLQLGGAAGTLAALGPQAPAIAVELGAELGLGVPALPWHTQRDNFVEFAGWLSLLLGSLGKLAQDVILLSQSEVGELAEAVPGARGGSSSMPQKNNPMRSEQILAAARAGAAQLSALHPALVQEHQRGTHGWQVEWLCLSPLVLLAGGALQNAQVLARDLEVDGARMRANLLAPPALAFAEAAVGALSSALPRPAAQSLLSTCAAQARTENRALIEVLREHAPQSALAGIDWEALARPENHLGQALRWVDETAAALIAAADEIEARFR